MAAEHPAPIRVLIADDQKVIREGLAMMLGLIDGIEVIGTAVDGADAVRQASTGRPDIVLMDLNMPTMDGVEATKRLVAAGSSARVVVLTTYSDDDWVFRALQAGARGSSPRTPARRRSAPPSPRSPPARPNSIRPCSGGCSTPWPRAPRSASSRCRRDLPMTD
jgi:CheY-like chemotaxis protein